MSRASPVSRALKLAAALALLHAACAASWPWEPECTWLRPSPDFVFLLAASLLASLAAGRVRGAVVAPFAALFFLVPLYRFARTAVPFFLGKPFEPWNDVLMLGGLHHLLTHRAPAWAKLPILCGAALAVLGLYALVFLSLRTVLRAAGQGRRAAAVLVVLQLVVAAGWIGRSLRAPEDAERRARGVLLAAASDATAIVRARAWRLPETVAAAAAAAQAGLDAAPQDLSRLDGVDLYVLWIESYGRAALGDAAGGQVRGLLSSLEAEVAAAGYSACSAYAFPSIRGGRSTLAHTELWCGVSVENVRVFDRVMESGIVPLSRRLAEKGWLALNVQPIMPEPWPEGDRFFGWEKSVFRKEFPYAGPQYPWGMPDQFALAHLERTELARPASPVLVHFVGVTSHAPFSLVPAYRPAWDGLEDPAAWAPERVRDIDWVNYPRHPEVERAYLDAIAYDLRTMIGFACRRARPSLLFVLGDHQPPGVGGLLRGEPGRDVPLHVLSNRAELLDPWLAQGFARGLVPDGGVPSFPLARFPYRFLHAYGR